MSPTRQNTDTGGPGVPPRTRTLRPDKLEARPPGRDWQRSLVISEELFRRALGYPETADQSARTVPHSPPPDENALWRRPVSPRPQAEPHSCRPFYPAGAAVLLALVPYHNPPTQLSHSLAQLPHHPPPQPTNLPRARSSKKETFVSPRSRALSSAGARTSPPFPDLVSPVQAEMSVHLLKQFPERSRC